MMTGSLAWHNDDDAAVALVPRHDTATVEWRGDGSSEQRRLGDDACALERRQQHRRAGVARCGVGDDAVALVRCEGRAG